MPLFTANPPLVGDRPALAAYIGSNRVYNNTNFWTFASYTPDTTISEMKFIFSGSLAVNWGDSTGNQNIHPASRGNFHQFS
jgi:hypothetical protein